MHALDPVHTYPYLNGEYGHRKRIFSKTLSRKEIFEKPGFSFTCGWKEMKVFEYYNAIVHIHVLVAFIMLSERDVTVFGHSGQK